MSAAAGVRDNNELSWSQVVDQVAFMAEATSIPVLLDGDTGYGNFNSMRRLVRKLEQVGVAGVTIEDKLFPKTNSFLRGELASAGRHRRVLRQDQGRQGQPGRSRLRAGGPGGGTHRGLGARRGPPAGRGLSRGRRRRDPDPLPPVEPGRDLRLPCRMGRAMSGRARADQVLAHAHRGFPDAPGEPRSSGPIIYFGPPSRPCRRRPGESARRNRLLNVEPEVAPLHEVFRLQGDDELMAAERRYLPAARGPALSAIVLAAGAGEGFAGLTAAVPKAMLKVQGRPILPRLLDDFAHFGCRSAVIVRGYRAEAIDVPGRTLRGQSPTGRRRARRGRWHWPRSTSLPARSWPLAISC